MSIKCYLFWVCLIIDHGLNEVFSLLINHLLKRLKSFKFFMPLKRFQIVFWHAQKR